MSFNNSFVPVLFASVVSATKPVRVWLGDLPVVLVKYQDTVHAYEDFCPHRGAPLSEGFVQNGKLICRYHGWEFSAEGLNIHVPVKNEAVPCGLKRITVEIRYGIVWISRHTDAVLPVLKEDTPAFTLQGCIDAGLLNTLENFLEGSHTHFVHDGLIRSKAQKRQSIEARIIPSSTGFSVVYETEPPKGLITALTPKRFRNLKAVSTFIYPSTSVLEYINQTDEVVARIEGILSEQNGKVHYLARVFIEAGFLTPLAKLFMKPLFAKVIAQDKKILEMQQYNLQRFKEYSFISDTTDAVGIELKHWLYAKDKITQEPYNFTVYW